MFFAVDVAFLLAQLGYPFSPAALAQAFVEVLPGWITVPLIELLKFWAERLLIIGLIVAFLACGGVAGLLATDARRRDLTVLGVGAAPWAAAVVLAQVFAPAKIDLPSSVVDAAAGACSFFLALVLIAPGAIAQAEVAGSGPSSPLRRRALLGAAGIAALAAIAGSALGGTVRGLAQSALGNVPLQARRLRTTLTLPPADPVIDAVAGIAPRVTSNEDHYVVDTALVKPRVDVTTWRLDIAGAVEAPFSLSYDQLLDLEAVEQAHTLECISNEIGGDLISTAVWTGVPLRELLARARPMANAFKVVFTSVDGYTDSFPIAKAMEPQTLVAYLMNGKTVPQDHGYPARVLVPNIYGMKNVKWLRKIEVVTYDYLGYWMERGWSDVATVNTNSRIDVPQRTLRWSGGEVSVVGIAFAGARGIAKVEVSLDGGASWREAQLEQPPGPLAWRRWAVRWTPPNTGTYRLFARSTDGVGNTETAVRRQLFPNGATGYHLLEVNVVRG